MPKPTAADKSNWARAVRDRLGSRRGQDVLNSREAIRRQLVNVGVKRQRAAELAWLVVLETVNGTKPLATNEVRQLLTRQPTARSQTDVTSPTHARETADHSAPAACAGHDGGAGDAVRDASQTDTTT